MGVRKEMMRVGSLFSGVGGFDLGLERAGMRVVWQCESDDFCRRVLAKHWPDVPCFGDVRELSCAAGATRVDVLCRGFPCQDISVAGKGVGIDGARSGLWSEYARLVGEPRPRYVIVENVPALLARGFGRVLADLAAVGYDAEWDCLPASAFGAPHRRDRVWLVAYPGGDGVRDESGRRDGANGSGPAVTGNDGAARTVADPECLGWPRGSERDGRGPASARRGRGSRVAANAESAERCEGGAVVGDGGEDVADAERTRRLQRRTRSGGAGEWRPPGVTAGVGEGLGGQWEPEPDVGRVAHGIPARVDRLRSLGNALVPQIAEWIGRRIVSYEEALEARSAAPLRQLTLDGGEVSHPPPRPRVRCPECDKLITLNDDGALRQHSDDYGQACPMAGRHLHERDA